MASLCAIRGSTRPRSRRPKRRTHSKRSPRHGPRPPIRVGSMRRIAPRRLRAGRRTPRRSPPTAHEYAHSGPSATRAASGPSNSRGRKIRTAGGATGTAHDLGRQAATTRGRGRRIGPKSRGPTRHGRARLRGLHNATRAAADVGASPRVSG